MLEFGAAGVGDGACEGGFGDADGNGAAPNLEPWKRDLHHRFESFPFLGQSGALVNVTIANQHRAAGISAKADAVPGATPLDAGAVLLNQVQRGFQYRRAVQGAGRDDVVIRIAGAGNERFVAIENHTTVVW